MMTETRMRADISKLKAARKAKQWSQEDLAKAAGYPLGTIQKLEQGTFFSFRCLECCAVALEIPVADLLKGGARPPHNIDSPETYDLCGQIRELHALGDDGRVRKLTKRYYYGKIANATLTIRGTEADLVINNIRMYDHPSCSKNYLRSSYCLRGHGLVVGNSVSIRYTVANDQTGRLSWAGVCVLSRPITGPSDGYWMTAGHKDRGCTVLGRLELRLKPLEEADGHDQREG
jgi:transcriptional regulator with XRE-family HTH domain